MEEQQLGFLTRIKNTLQKIFTPEEQLHSPVPLNVQQPVNQPQPVQGPPAPQQPMGPPAPQQPIPQPTPTVIPEFQDVQPDIQNIIREYFPDVYNEAINIAARESGLNPGAIGQNYNAEGVPSSQDYGLFQINDRWQGPGVEKAGMTMEDMLDAIKNVQYARQLYEQQGWNPWATAPDLGYAE